MSSAPIEEKIYELAPGDGFTVTHFITVADIARWLASTKKSSAAAF
jgi:hypothetical protein